MRIPASKLKLMIRYFYSHTDKRVLGKTKLMKLFYFADFTHIKKFGTPITYDTYYHLEHGPIPSTILNLVNNVIDEPDTAILADTMQIKNAGSGIQQIECLSEFSEQDEKYFSKNELETLAKVCRKFYGSAAGQLEKISHDESPWSKTKELDEIPYTLAADDSDSLVSKDLIELSLAI